MVACGSTSITDKDMLIAAKTLADCLSQERLNTGCLYPDWEDIREVKQNKTCVCNIG